MFLLIPKEQKDGLMRQYKLRLVFLVIAILSMLCAYGIITLLPSYFVAHSEEEGIILLKNNIDKSIIEKSDEDLENTLLDIKQNLSALQEKDRNSVSLIEQVVQKKPKNVNILKFNYFYNTSEESTLRISGVSLDRESLILFSKNLQSNPLFSKVDLPISNLAKDSNIEFNITISGNF